MDRSGPGGVHQLLVTQANRRPDTEAFVVVAADGSHSSISYRSFLEEVERHAVAFDEAGIGRGDAVVLHLGTSLDFLTCWYACLRLGALAVPTNLASPAPELAHAVDVTGARHVVSEPALADVVEAIDAHSARPPTGRLLARTGTERDGWTNLRAAIASVEAGRTVDVAAPRAEDPAEVLFTSGTTSKPKGALLTNANLIRAGDRVSLHYALTDEDRVLSVMPLFHTGGQCMGLMAALAVGTTCVLVERYGASSFWDQVRAHRATFVMLVATHVTTLLAQPTSPDDRHHPLRRTAFGLMITDAERDAFEDRHGVRLTYCFGQTEACLLIAIVPPFGERRWPAMGPPAFDRIVRIVDGEGTDLPTGELGEIVVSADPGRDVMLGYVNDPAATAETIRDGWLHTGDNGFLDDAGYLHFVDRRKDMIKRAGENISALEVETVLTAHPRIAEAAVIGVPDPIRNEAVKAFVVTDGAGTVTLDEVRAHCGEWLAEFKLPTELEVLDELPKTSIGKISKKALRGL